jgi:hypothetical protein
MKTNDGFELKDGELCWVGIQDPMGKKLSPKPRAAIYRSKYAIDSDLDFEIPDLRLDRDVEVIAVWKNKPISEVSK